MIVENAELTPYGEMVLDENSDCEFCGRSMIARFGGPVFTNECESCASDFSHAGHIQEMEIPYDG